MDYIAGLLDRITELANRLLEALFGPELQSEPELIPIPVRDRR